LAILTRHSDWTAGRIGKALSFWKICGDPIELAADDHDPAAALALEHKLTFCDAPARRLLAARDAGCCQPTRT
jgi:hypothetical protein